MHVTLVAAISFDGRLLPLAAAPPLPGVDRVVGFLNRRRESTVCDWLVALPAGERVECEIRQPAASPIAAALLKAGLVDELRVTVSPLVSGRRNAPTLLGPPPPEFLPAAIRLQLLTMETEGGICVLRYRVKKPGAGAKLAASAPGEAP